MENSKTTFILPEDITIIDVLSEILKNAGIEETMKERIQKISENKTSRLITIRDIALSIADKKIPERDLNLLLQTQLSISEEKAKGIISDINQKLMPFAKKINFDQEKITLLTEDEKDSSLTFIKKPAFLNVEENAKILKKDEIATPPKKQTRIKKPTTGEINNAAPKIKQRSGPDNYREPIE